MSKKKNKWIVSLASAALVASAIVPVANAASFSDIANNDHKEAILALAEAGIITGYPDGTFKPNAIVTRGNVTKLLGKWLVSEGYKIPEDYKTEARFSDLPVDFGDEELVQYAALVKDAGVFKGSNNRLMHVNNMSREQMALVLVRAINTVYGVDLIADYKAENYESKITDLDKANADENREAIIALEYKGITKVTTFNPKNSLTRGQFASFLHRAIENVGKEEVLAAKEVEAQIAELPADKFILENGEKILTTKNAYDALSDYAKTFVSEDSKKLLDQTVSNFKLFNKSDINGLQMKIAKADTLEAKKAVVEAAKENLEIAKALGISDSEYNFLNDMIVEGEKTVAREELEFAKAAAKEVEAQIAKLPADKDILESGEVILNTQKAYDTLSEQAKGFVNEEAVKSLNKSTATFKLFVKSSINGLQQEISKAEEAADKKAVVAKATANLEIAKELGMEEMEYNFYKGLVAEGEKVVAGL